MKSLGTHTTFPKLQQMKRDGRKIVGVVAWDYQIAQIVDRVGVDIVSVGDTVGINLWGHSAPLEITMEEMFVVCKPIRRGAKRKTCAPGARSKAPHPPKPPRDLCIRTLWILLKHRRLTR
jgi:ketopantoate hydroxymethyltransferase